MKKLFRLLLYLTKKEAVQNEQPLFIIKILKNQIIF